MHVSRLYQGQTSSYLRLGSYICWIHLVLVVNILYIHTIYTYIYIYIYIHTNMCVTKFAKTVPQIAQELNPIYC